MIFKSVVKITVTSLEMINTVFANSPMTLLMCGGAGQGYFPFKELIEVRLLYPSGFV
jgi:hypothetical protein